MFPKTPSGVEERAGVPLYVPGKPAPRFLSPHLPSLPSCFLLLHRNHNEENLSCLQQTCLFRIARRD